MMSRVKSLFVLALVVMCFLSKEAFATHAMGGDITYKCLGNDSYLLTLKFYRDCNGIPAPVGGSDLVFKVSSPTCNASFTRSFVPVPDSTEIITPICFAAVDRCTSSSGVFGIEKYVYQYTLDLSSYNGCGDDWKLEWDYCCRNNAITSLQSPGSQQIYLSTTIDNTLNAHNHSPEFRNEPTPFGCVLQEMTYNHGVRDLDGDSLVFSLAPARTFNGNTITYASGYSASQPIKTTTGVQIDPQTGSLTFTPSVQQVAVVSVLVEEYRNGVKINELIRDVQFSIVQCANFLPTITGFDSTDNFTIDACVGDTVCYTFYSNDADPGDSVYLSWNQGIVGAVFTTTNGIDKKAKATLCWVPQESNIGPNLFSITARDNACDLNGVSAQGYKIQVFPSANAQLPQDFAICSDSTITVTGNLPNGTVNSGWSLVVGNADTTELNDSTIQLSNFLPGVSSLVWELNYGSCGTRRDTVNILAYDVSLVTNAGPDQLDLCIPTAETDLDATIDSLATGFWTVISGSGVFADATDPKTHVSGLDPDNDNVFQWNVENGPCKMMKDQVRVTLQKNCLNEPPTVVDTTFVTIPEDSTVLICIDYTDPDNDSVYIQTVIQNATNGIITIDTGTCFVYDPDTNFNGTDTIIVVICDSAIFSICDTVVVIITVTPVNDAPIAVDDYATTPRDSTVMINVLLNDSDVDGDDLTATIFDGPNNGTATIDANGIVTYVPDTFFSGMDTITYVLCDDGVPVLCDTALVIIDVDGTVFPPEIVDTSGNPIDTIFVSVPEDSFITICLQVVYNGLDTLAITNASLPSNGTIVVDSTDLCITYIPDSNYTGIDTITVIVCNQDEDPLCDTVVVIITVTPVNDPPFAHDDYLNIDENTTGVVDVLQNDFDVDGDSLIVTIISDPSSGTATVDGNGNIVYIPDPDFNGMDTLVYQVCDNGTPVLCDTATVYIIVGGPIIVDTSGNPIDTIFETIPEDSSIQICLNVIYFGTDSLVVIPAIPPSNGIVLIDTGFCFTYIPDSNFNGTDTFIISICEDTLFPNCDSIVVIIEVTPVNDPPVANDDSVIVMIDTSGVIINVLANDYDVDGDSLSVSILDGPSHGTAIVNEDNTVTYVPDSGFCGYDQILYIACDSFLCDSAFIYIFVDCGNEPPNANNDTITTFEDIITLIDILNNDSDPNGVIDTANIQIIVSTTNGTITIDANGQVTYTPDPNFNGVDSFTYVICDGGIPQYCDTATVIIIVLPVNDPPIAVDDIDSVDVQGSVTISPLDNDSDIDGNLLWSNFTIIDGPTHGSYTLTSDGQLIYTPGMIADDTITYVICDDGTPLPEECDTALIIFQVGYLECFIPQGFSPNNDGLNDLFIIPCLENYPEAELYVYNRWGDEVYGSDGPYLNNWWNGSNRNGEQLPSGNYFFLLDLKTDGRKPISNYVVIMN